MVDSTDFFKLIEQIEARESLVSATWNPINANARQAERCKAYEKMFYQFLDGRGFA